MSAARGSAFDVARPTGHCAATGRAFVSGERYVAVLAERNDSDELRRFDFAAEAWEDGARPQSPWRVIASWRAVAVAPEEKRRVLVEDEELLDLFEQLSEAAEPRAVAFRYLLALILIRKRLLRLESSRRAKDGRGVLLVRPRGGSPDAPPIEVADPGMDEQAIAAGMEELGRVMAGGEAGAEAGSA